MNFNTHSTQYAQHSMKKIPVFRRFSEGGYVLAFVVVVMVILIMLSIGEMMSAYQARIQAVSLKSQTDAMLAAEAGYEKAIFWMSQQPDILGALEAGGGSGNLTFDLASCRYQVGFDGYMGQRSLFKIAVVGTSGAPVFGRCVNVDVVQEVTGWAMGLCQIATGSNSTSYVYFADGEIIDMPIHINNAKDSPDDIDIHIIGSPVFKHKVEMGESRKTSGGTDKYASVMNCFTSGISFDQPYLRITDATAVTSKITRFKNSTNPAYRFTPTAVASGPSGTTRTPAVQLEFYVQGNVGQVCITNNCSVVLNNPSPYDYNIVTGSNPATFNTYKIYGYHYKPNDAANQITIPITNTYVTQTFGGYTSDPGGQIYVNGNVVIGGDSVSKPDQVVKGKLTIVATGNIWIGDNIVVDGDHDVNGMPTSDNPNVLGLIAQGIIKVVDPGQSPTSPASVTGYTYQPIGNKRDPQPTYPGRWLPNYTIVEAAITVGGGGWGAEYVGGRRVYTSPQDHLIVHGSISEAIRGVVGIIGANGYLKEYHMDNRLTEGILPGDIWFSGKYIPAPDGWQDYRTSD